ncbi:hypothetical protein OG413_33635 [Streptomyces sp. NBC_01433]|uniref:hypothetical protein n=1 Tax=Streptomyces sp. NBC_01433 TaxID=2903864 RepID=UPI00225B191A|nr:hypothetical protein [Streptomyces sp. NBC_01433]MCX4680159.1 hypothetical protein [Streptomyces sp. NBC_01433]
MSTLTNIVNLYCRTDPATYDGSGNASLTITVGNFASVAATGPVSLKVITPFYANVNALPTVTGATSSWLYQNTAVDVPSIIQVSFNGFPANSTQTVTVSMSLASGAPNIPSFGRAIFTTDAANTIDHDSDLTRNVWPFLFVRASLATPTPGNTNLYYTTPQTPLVAGGSAAYIPFNFYNGAGTLLSGTGHPAHFTFSTPFYTRVPTAGRPSGFTALYENNDPAIPSVYQLAVPAGIGLLGPALPTTVNIPFQVQTGAPRDLIPTTAIVVPTGTDTQGDLSTALSRFGVLSTVNTAV